MSRHRYTDCRFRNATPANPGRYRIVHNAKCSCLEQLHPNKMNTNIPRRILNSYNRKVDPSTALVHSRMEVHIFFPPHHWKDLYILQYFGSYKSKALLYLPIKGIFTIGASTRFVTWLIITKTNTAPAATT